MRYKKYWKSSTKNGDIINNMQAKNYYGEKNKVENKKIKKISKLAHFNKKKKKSSENWISFGKNTFSAIKFFYTFPSAIYLNFIPGFLLILRRVMMIKKYFGLVTFRLFSFLFLFFDRKTKCFTFEKLK